MRTLIITQRWFKSWNWRLIEGEPGRHEILKGYSATKIESWEDAVRRAEGALKIKIPKTAQLHARQLPDMPIPFGRGSVRTVLIFKRLGQ